jgi:hypothetical protein
MNTITAYFASRTSSLVFLAMAGALMLFGAASPEAFVSGDWNLKLLQSVLIFLGAGLAAHLALNFQKQLFSARAGGWLLHAGLLMTIAGGAWNYTASEIQSVEAIEGQTIEVFDGQRIFLEKFLPFYKPGRHFKGVAASIRAHDGEAWGKEPQVVYKNNPGYTGGTEILIGRHGFATRLRFMNESGRTLEHAYVSLETRLPEFEPQRRSYLRTVPLPGSTHSIDLDFSPSPADGFPTDPKLSIRISGKENDKGVVLKPGEFTNIVGIIVAFEDVRYWSHFKLRQDPGLPLLFTGLVLTIIGSGIAFWRSLANR